MDLDAAADELYAISPDDFMARRTALVAEAKKTGDKALAKQIGALRKPTRSAWLVNLVARTEPEQLSELIALAGELQSAQAAMDGDALRTLSKQRRSRIDALTRRAIALGREAGYAAADGSLAEVGSTLQAALGDPAVAEQVRAGRLAQAVAYGGFDGLAATSGGDLTAALAASMPAKPERKLKAVPPLPPDAEEVPESGPEPEPDPEAVERARQLRAAADEAAAALEAAETTADEATTRADELADEMEALRTRLKDTEAAEREAREDARAARKALTEARRAAAAAGQAATRAEADLTT